MKPLADRCKEATERFIPPGREHLIAEEAPIVPVYFYAGFNYFESNQDRRIYQNILDEHPLQNDLESEMNDEG